MPLVDGEHQLRRTNFMFYDNHSIFRVMGKFSGPREFVKSLQEVYCRLRRTQFMRIHVCFVARFIFGDGQFLRLQLLGCRKYRLVSQQWNKSNRFILGFRKCLRIVREFIKSLQEAKTC